MKIYITGKITGDPAYRAKFADAQRQIEAQAGAYRAQSGHAAGGHGTEGLYAHLLRHDRCGGQGSVFAGLVPQHWCSDRNELLRLHREKVHSGVNCGMDSTPEKGG